MNVGDLVELKGVWESFDAERDPIVGVLMGYNRIEDGWDILIGESVECFPKTWWRVTRLSLRSAVEEE